MEYSSYTEESVIDDRQPCIEKELSAIFNLDFERALELSARRNHVKDSEATSEQYHYEEQAQMLSQQNFDNYHEEVNRISQEYLKNADYFKNMWQINCKNLVERHRKEALQLEQKWRDARRLETNRSNLQTETSYSTARILAMCEHYHEAIDVRDNAIKKITDSKKPPEIRLIDREFVKTYKIMTKRHFSEFQLLHRHLKSLMRSLRDRAENLKKNAEANLKVEEARNTTLIIQTVAKDGISPVAKEKVIKSFSPRKKTRFSSRQTSLKNISSNSSSVDIATAPNAKY